MAKEAVTIGAPESAPVPLRDLHPCIKEYVIDLWQRKWDELPSTKLHPIKSSVLPWPRSIRSRRMEAILCRLRVGHTRLTHGYLMDGQPPPLCAPCNVQLSILHILTECPFFNLHRMRIFPFITPDVTPPQALRLILAETSDFFSVERIVKFLTDSMLLKEI